MQDKKSNIFDGMPKLPKPTVIFKNSQSLWNKKAVLKYGDLCIHHGASMEGFVRAWPQAGQVFEVAIGSGKDARVYRSMWGGNFWLYMPPSPTVVFGAYEEPQPADMQCNILAEWLAGNGSEWVIASDADHFAPCGDGTCDNGWCNEGDAECFDMIPCPSCNPDGVHGKWAEKDEGTEAAAEENQG